MRSIGRFSLLVLIICSTALLVTILAQTGEAVGDPAPRPVSENWPVFHHDHQHSGVNTTVSGDINSGTGPNIRWRYQMADIPTTEISGTRWTSTFPLGDLNGDGTLEVVVTSPGTASGPNRILALRDQPGQSPPVEPLWIYTTTDTLDMYSPALTQVNNDGLLDVVFSDGEGVIRALEGFSGQLLWEYDSGRDTEAGPTVGNVDGTGDEEVVLVTACQNFGEECDKGGPARLIVLPANASGSNSPIWETSYKARLDSAVPALADIDPSDGADRLAIVAGSWGGELLVAWQRPDGEVISDTFDLLSLLPFTPTETITPAVRSSPLVWDFGSGPTAVFGWVPDPNNPADARISAIHLSADMTSGTDVSFVPLWTEPYAVWKSSITLLPVSNPPLIAAGYGLANVPGGQSGPVGACLAQYLFGGIIALNANGTLAWQNDYGSDQGNIRGSAAVADIDGDGELEIVLPVGCYGRLYAYDGLTGEEEWYIQLGPRSQNSPAIGDLDGDGAAEIVLGSYDGYVWALSGGGRAYIPAVSK